MLWPILWVPLVPGFGSENSGGARCVILNSDQRANSPETEAKAQQDGNAASIYDGVARAVVVSVKGMRAMYLVACRLRSGSLQGKDPRDCSVAKLRNLAGLMCSSGAKTNNAGQ